jgi:sphinganine-1-phosphate aldolase
MSTPTAAGTRPGGAIAGAWAVMNYLGVEGYREKARIVTDTREKLMRGLESIDGLRTFGDPKLGLFTFGSDEIDIFQVYGKLLKRGWFSGLVTEPRAIHMMLSPAHAEVADEFLEDVATAVAAVGESSNSEPGVEARYS